MAGGVNSGKAKFASLLLLFQGILLILFVVFIDYDEGLLPSDKKVKKENTSKIDGEITICHLFSHYMWE